VDGRSSCVAFVMSDGFKRIANKSRKWHTTHSNMTARRLDAILFKWMEYKLACQV